MERLQNPVIFPTKLWRLINDSDIGPIVWNSHGDGIIIQPKLLESQFMPILVKQLHVYGFRKTVICPKNKSNVQEYFHPNFNRSQPELLPLVQKKAQHKCDVFPRRRVDFPGPQPKDPVCLSVKEKTSSFTRDSKAETVTAQSLSSNDARTNNEQNSPVSAAVADVEDSIREAAETLLLMSQQSYKKQNK